MWPAGPEVHLNLTGTNKQQPPDSPQSPATTADATAASHRQASMLLA
jgi:hypothetical protein